MRFLSLFSGLGGFDLALERAGMTCVGQAENDKDCLRVLQHHWPDVWRVEDVRSVGGDSCGRRDAQIGADSVGADWADGQRVNRDAESSIDLVCGGFPCQPFSVAGRRDGEADERNLWPEFRRVVRELRPRWVVAENVPGLLSIDEGRFFGSILDDLGECGFPSVAYAVLDSRHFGVAQRRRRVFIVAGSTRRSAEQVLSLCESCGGHPAAGRAAGESVAAPLGASATSFGGQRYDLDNETYIPDVVPALVAPALDTNLGTKQWLGDQDVENYGLMMEATAIRTAQTGANGIGVQADQAYTLDGTQQAVAFHENLSSSVTVQDGTAALRAGASHSYQFTHAGASVRRLTPTECLRLQALPDDWLDLNPPLSDGAKYRMVGNAVTVSVVQWIGERIMALEAV